MREDDRAADAVRGAPEDAAADTAPTSDTARTPDAARADVDALAAAAAEAGPARSMRSPGREPSQPASPLAAPGTPPPEAPGLKDQVGRTRDAAKSLVAAHVDLAKAEFGEIADEIKQVAILAGLAFAAALIAGLLIPIGLALFIGETLFGSLGWGVLHGPLFLIGVAVAAVLAALRLGGGTIARDFALAVVVGAIVGVVFALDLTNIGWTRLGEALNVPIEPGVRPLAVGAATLAIVVGVIGLVVGAWRAGYKAALGGLVGGAIAGAVIGAFTAIAFGPRVGAALGVTAALILWPVFMGLSVQRKGVDGDALKERFYPSTTIDTTKETIEWVRSRTPLGRGS